MKPKASSTAQTFILKLSDVEKSSGPSQERHPESRSASDMAAVSAKLHDLVVSMEAMRDELRGQRGLLSRLIPKVNEDDRQTLSKLLPAIGSRYGSSAWTAREIAEDMTFSKLIGGRSSGSLGKLLSRNENCSIDGLSVVRVKHESGRMLWAVYESITL